MVFVKHNSLKLDIFFNPIVIPGFSGSGSRVQGPGPESRVRVQGPVLGPGSRVQGPGSRVQGPGPGPGFRSSQTIQLFSEAPTRGVP